MFCKIGLLVGIMAAIINIEGSSMWLLDVGVKDAIVRAQDSRNAPTAAEYIDFVASAGDSRILTTVGNNAEVGIKGVLTSGPDWFARVYGGGNTTYPEIISALIEADRDTSVDNITLRINSPGGHVNGLFDALEAIKAVSKPVKAVVDGQAASAAFAIATQADTIEASNKAVAFGSVGVAVSAYVSDNVHDVTSTEAPKKRPDIRTDEGRAVIREGLDAIHDLFVEAIAEGRGTTTAKVNANYGKGATLLAGEALERGMIDSIAGPKINSALSEQQPGAIDMDLKTLKLQHADVYEAAVQAGVTQERDRVNAHIIAGEAVGAMDTAITAIKDGSELTASLQATYMAAGVNRRDQEQRREESEEATRGNNPDSSNPADESDIVASLVEGMLGTEV